MPWKFITFVNSGLNAYIKKVDTKHRVGYTETIETVPRKTGQNGKFQ